MQSTIPWTIFYFSIISVSLCSFISFLLLLLLLLLLISFLGRNSTNITPQVRPPSKAWRQNLKLTIERLALETRVTVQEAGFMAVGPYGTSQKYQDGEGHVLPANQEEGSGKRSRTISHITREGTARMLTHLHLWCGPSLGATCGKHETCNAGSGHNLKVKGQFFSSIGLQVLLIQKQS